MPNIRPIYKVTIQNPGGREYQLDSWGSSYGRERWKNINKLTIYIDRDLDKPLDMFRIRLSTEYGVLGIENRIKPGAAVKIYLGYYSERLPRVPDGLNEDNLVLTGLVDEVSQDLNKIVITGYSEAYKIVVKKPGGDELNNQEDKSSRNIIRLLLANTGVITDNGDFFEQGMTFKNFVPDDDKSIYDNINWLADLNGFAVYFSRKGKLRFYRNPDDNNPLNGRNIEYATDILENAITTARPPYDKITVQVSHVPGHDDDKVSVLSTEPVEGSSIMGKNKVESIAMTSGIVQTKEDAQRIAKNKLNKLYRPESGQVKILGEPDIEMCDKINLKFRRARNNPPGAESLDYMKREGVRVTKITHKFNMKSGFVTVIGWVGQAQAAGVHVNELH
jgi:hypothetical protein